MTTTPCVSVIIAAYNGAAVLPEQLEALAQQVDAPAFEVLVMDNMSPDDVTAAVRPFESELDIRVLEARAGQGQASARNEGALQARGEHLLFCDQDDRVSPRWVALLHEQLTQEDCLATGPLELRHFNRDAVRILFAGSDADEVTPYTVAGYLPFAYGCNLGVRRSTFVALDGFDNSYQGGGEDQDLCWRAQEAGIDIRMVPEAAVSYRLRSEPEGLFRQQVGYAYSSNLLKARSAHRGVHQPSPKWVAQNLLGAVRDRLRMRRASPDEAIVLARDAGVVVGSLKAVVAYRLLRRLPQPQLLSSITPPS